MKMTQSMGRSLVNGAICSLFEQSRPYHPADCLLSYSTLFPFPTGTTAGIWLYTLEILGRLRDDFEGPDCIYLLLIFIPQCCRMYVGNYHKKIVFKKRLN